MPPLLVQKKSSPKNDPYWKNVVLSMGFNDSLGDAKGHSVTSSGTVSVVVDGVVFASYGGVEYYGGYYHLSGFGRMGFVAGQSYKISFK